MSKREYHSLIWVCVCCMLTHANGECCEDDSHGGDYHEPWATTDFDRFDVTMGMISTEHDDECQSQGWDECDCDHDTFSRSQCEGCGSYLHGERHAFTLWTK